MIFYRLHVEPGEYEAEGEDHDEWFTALRVARRRRAELIRGYDPADPNAHLKLGSDYAIDRVEIDTAGPLRPLILALLSRKGFAKHSVEVVPAWRPQDGPDSEEADGEEIQDST